MYHPPIFNDPGFTVSVMVGWVLTVAGAAILLLAAFWFSFAGEELDAASKPAGFRVLSGLGFAMFLGGLLWQLVGYLAVGVLDW